MIQMLRYPLPSQPLAITVLSDLEHQPAVMKPCLGLRSSFMNVERPRKCMCSGRPLCSSPVVLGVAESMETISLQARPRM